MNPTAAFAVALAVTAAGGVAARRMVRAGRSRPSSRSGAAWREVHQRRVDLYADFAAPAEEIGRIVETWPTLPPRVRQYEVRAVREHLQTLRQRLAAVMLEGGPDVQAAANQLVDDCGRIAGTLARYAPPGPLDTTAHGLTLPFLTAGREYLDAESERHFGLRGSGRSLFGRLAAR